MPIFGGAAACGVLMFALREGVCTAIAGKRDAYKYTLDHKRYDQIYYQIWLRDRNGSVVHLTEFRPTTESNPTAQVRGLEATLRADSHWSSTTADRAVYAASDDTPEWQLEHGIRGARIAPLECSASAVVRGCGDPGVRHRRGRSRPGF